MAADRPGTAAGHFEDRLGVVGDATLLTWPEVEARLPRNAVVLLGNGASIAIWEAFSYDSLFEVARSEVATPLDDEDGELFTALSTTNFEAVLAALHTSRIVADALGAPTRHLAVRYLSIQRALHQAVARSHVPHHALGPEFRDRLRTAYRRYHAIYTTNYDLVTYWGIMPAEIDFVDFFFSPGLSFDRDNTEVWRPGATELLFLHGAVHLRRTSDGGARKELGSDAGLSLLEAFDLPFSEGETPLFITEGTSAEKEHRIRTSDYLSFALDRLSNDERPLVVVGHSLGSQDDHIVKAINEHPERPIAVGVYAGSGDVRTKKLTLASRLSTSKVVFFDSRTHPLTSPALRVRLDEE